MFSHLSRECIGLSRFDSDVLLTVSGEKYAIVHIQSYISLSALPANIFSLRRIKKRSGFLGDTHRNDSNFINCLAVAGNWLEFGMILFGVAFLIIVIDSLVNFGSLEGIHFGRNSFRKEKEPLYNDDRTINRHYGK